MVGASTALQDSATLFSRGQTIVIPTSHEFLLLHTIVGTWNNQIPNFCQVCIKWYIIVVLISFSSLFFILGNNSCFFYEIPFPDTGPFFYSAVCLFPIHLYILGTKFLEVIWLLLPILNLWLNFSFFTEFPD